MQQKSPPGQRWPCCKRSYTGTSIFNQFLYNFSRYLIGFAPMQVFRGAGGAKSAAGWPQGHFSVPLLLLFEQFCTDTGLSRRDRCRIGRRLASRALFSALAPSI
jgi:hypothetical protein